MSFPLFQRPGAIVFLDDDPDYLEMLALVLPRHWHVRLFCAPAGLHRQAARRSRRPGTPMPGNSSRWWTSGAPASRWCRRSCSTGRRRPERYGLTRVCVVDFSMPQKDGLQVLAELTEWQGSRVLLTGQADEQVAVNAFNRGLIEQFIAKQMPDMSRHLVNVMHRLLATPHPRHAQTWRATLKPEHNTVLRELERRAPNCRSSRRGAGWSTS